MTVRNTSTDPTTGAQKDNKIERFDLIPVAPLRMLAKHYGIGSKKYADRNWEKGYNWSWSFAAACRHIWKFWGGEWIDPESKELDPEGIGTPHVICAAWHMFAIANFYITHPEKDDRSK